MISDKRTSGLLGQLGNIKNDEEFEKYISENTFNNYSDDKNNVLTFSAYYNSILAEEKAVSPEFTSLQVLVRSL